VAQQRQDEDGPEDGAGNLISSSGGFAAHRWEQLGSRTFTVLYRPDRGLGAVVDPQLAHQKKAAGF